MSIRGLYTIWCEAPGCLAWLGQEDTRAAVRKLAKSYGWAPGTRYEPDLCAGHKANPVPADHRDGAKLLPDGTVWKCTYCGKYMSWPAEARAS